MGMGFAPTWLRQVSPLLHMTTLITDYGGSVLLEMKIVEMRWCPGVVSHEDTSIQVRR